jgi:hypothetical protein
VRACLRPCVKRACVHVRIWGAAVCVCVCVWGGGG